MGSLARDRVPATADYMASEGLTLKGQGAWRTTSCDLHGGSDSMRVNTRSGGWCCMACGAKGGDVIGYLMARDGLDFIAAARHLGAWDERLAYADRAHTPKLLAPREAMEVVGLAIAEVFVVISDVREGLLPSPGDWEVFVRAPGRIEALAAEYAT